ncbi:holin [Mycobacterium phage IronMan]|uniref:Holin n=1 Tax=Mycobacterium phage IronMan TaxID=2499042 RepID=A0A3S9UD46_9CAUD|nr:holin [Mycobacterium phage IronMan]AZS08214.1 holin [Mycobacterium phage IronMan]
MSPKVRQTIYYLGTIVPGVLGIALVWGGIDAGAANSIGDIIAGALALIGASAPATAAVQVGKQRKDGTLATSAVEQVTKGVEQVIAARDAAQAEVERVTQAVGGVLGDVQRAAEAINLGPLASQILKGLPNAYPQPFAPQPFAPQAYGQPYDHDPVTLPRIR